MLLSFLLLSFSVHEVTIDQILCTYKNVALYILNDTQLVPLPILVEQSLCLTQCSFYFN